MCYYYPAFIKPGQQMIRIFTRRQFVLGLLLSSSVAFAHGPSRLKVKETISIQAPPAEVWAMIGNFDSAHTWLPMVESSTAEGGNDEGASRTLVLGPGVEIFEILKRHSDEKMSYSYKIPTSEHDVSILPVTNYASTISVKADGDGSMVMWKGAFYRGYPNNDPPADLNDDAAIAAVTSVYKAGLEHLKKLFENPG